MDKIIIGENINQKAIGYVLNAELSPKNQHAIAKIQKTLSEKLGSAIWNSPPVSLHITLFDWLAPLVDYGRDKTEIFEEIFAHYDRVIADATRGVGTIVVKFDKIRVGPAAIWVEGSDNGQFRKIREEFLSKVDLLPNTKLPPKIIHTTVSRYREEIDLAVVQKVVDEMKCSFVQEISGFRLIKETVDPMLEFETIKTYPLTSVV